MLHVLHDISVTCVASVTCVMRAIGVTCVVGVIQCALHGQSGPVIMAHHSHHQHSVPSS